MDLSPFLLQENESGFRAYSSYKSQIPKALVARPWYVRKICNFCKMVTHTFRVDNKCNRVKGHGKIYANDVIKK